MTSTRRAKRFLSAEQKYDLWVRMLTGQINQTDAAAEAGVDRTTIAHHPFAAVFPETPLIRTASPSERPWGIPVAISIGEAFVAARIENHCGSGRFSVAAPLVKEEFASLLK